MPTKDPGRRLRLRTGERNGAEIRERHERAVRLEVVDDPLGVLLTERGGRRDLLGDSLALGVARDHRCARCRAGGGDGRRDGVVWGEGDVGEVVGVAPSLYVANGDR